MLNIKKIKGFSLLETFVAITVLTALIVAFAYSMNEKNKLGVQLKLANDLTTLTDGVSNRLDADVYIFDKWGKTEWNNNSEIFGDLVAKELRAKDSSCGEADGWDAASSGYPKFEAVPCSTLNQGALPFNIQSKAKITKDIYDGEEIVGNFNIELYFKSQSDFKKGMFSLLSVKDKLEYKSGRNLNRTAILVDVNDVDRKPIDLKSCLAKGIECALQINVETFDLMITDRLKISGANSMMAELDFDNSIDSCDIWSRSPAGVWSSEKSDCAIKGGYDAVDGKVLARLNGVHVSDRFSLNKKCKIYETEIINGVEYDKDSATFREFSCGMFNDKIITIGYVEGDPSSAVISADKTDIENSVSTKLITDIQFSIDNIISNDLNVGLLTDTNLIKSAKSIDSTGSITGDAGSIIKSYKILQGVDGNTAEFNTKKLEMLDEAGAPVNGSYLYVDNKMTVGGDYVSDLSFSDYIEVKNLLADQYNNNYLNPRNVFPYALNTLTADTPVVIRSASEKLKKYLVDSNGKPTYPDRLTRKSVINNDLEVREFHSGKNDDLLVSEFKVDGLNQFGETNTGEINITGSENKITITSKTNKRLIDEYGFGNDGIFSSESPSLAEFNIIKEGLSLTSSADSVLKASKINIYGGRPNTTIPADWKSSFSSTAPNTLVSPQVLAKDKINVVNGDIIVKKDDFNKIIMGRDGMITINKQAGDSGSLHLGGHDFTDSYISSGSTSINDAPGFKGAVYVGENLFINSKTIDQLVPFFAVGNFYGQNICNGSFSGSPTNECLNNIYYNHQKTYEKYLAWLPYKEIFDNKLNTLKSGNKGEKGDKGVAGLNGLVGEEGEIGNRGPQGPMAYRRSGYVEK